MNIKDLGKGAVPDPPDNRDYYFEKVFGEAEFDWKKGYDVEREIGEKLKVENQNGSSSCVAQAFSKYAEVLEVVENRKFTDLSARDIYSRIYLPTGGAYLRAGARLMVKRGVLTEKTCPSYERGKPPKEPFMREKVEGKDKEAMVYASKAYYTTWHKSNFDMIARLIETGHGAVTGVSGTNSGWKTGNVKPPKAGEKTWGHAIFLGKAALKNGRKKLGFLNSWSSRWGENGWGWLGEEYSKFIFSIWTLIDKPNVTSMLKLKIDKNNDQYLVDEKTEIAFSIADEKELEVIRQHHNFGKPEVFDPTGYLVLHGSTAKRLKEFFNLMS